MLDWIMENLATIIICLVLAGIVIKIAAVMIKNKREGKISCGCGCQDCAMQGSCHSKK